MRKAKIVHWMRDGRIACRDLPSFGGSTLTHTRHPIRRSFTTVKENATCKACARIK